MQHRRQAAERREASRACSSPHPSTSRSSRLRTGRCAAGPKRVSLPSMLPPDCVTESDWSAPSDREESGCRAVRPASPSPLNSDEDREHHRHEHAGPGCRSRTQPPNATTSANGISRSAQISQEVGEPVGVLERVRGVGVEEAAAVGAELLDRLLRGDRAAGDRLLVIAVQSSRSTGRSIVRCGVAVEVLHHALRHQDDGEHEASGRRMRSERADEVDPEVAEVAGAACG